MIDEDDGVCKHLLWIKKHTSWVTSLNLEDLCRTRLDVIEVLNPVVGESKQERGRSCCTACKRVWAGGEKFTCDLNNPSRRVSTYAYVIM